MAKKFTQLPAVQSLTLNDILAVVNGGESRKATLDQVRELLAQPSNLLYVSQGGSDITGDGTILAPFASIQAAITAVGTPQTPYAITVGPGDFGDAQTALSVPSNVTIQGSVNTNINASSITLGDEVFVFDTNINSPTVTINQGAKSYIQNVSLKGNNTTITNSSSSSTIYATNVTAQGNVTYEGGTVIQQSNRYDSALIISNVTNYSAVANSSLSVSVSNSTATISASTSGSLTSTNSTTKVNSSSIPGNVTATGGSLTVGGSSIDGTVTGAGGAVVALSLDSYPQAGASVGGGSTLTNTSNVAQNIPMYASATSGATVVGTVYFPQSKTLSTDSLAYIGGITQNDSTALSLVPAGGGNPVATWTRTGLLGNQALASPASISLAGWYDIVLTPGASGTAFARGLYLV